MGAGRKSPVGSGAGEQWLWTADTENNDVATGGEGNLSLSYY